MTDVGYDISSGDVTSVNKCINGGVGVIVGGNICWDVSSNVGAIVDVYVVGELGSCDNVGYELKVEN